MKMEELLSAADEMEQTKNESPISSAGESDIPIINSSINFPHSKPITPHVNSHKTKTSLPSPPTRNSMRTRSKKDSIPPSFAIDAEIDSTSLLPPSSSPATPMNTSNNNSNNNNNNNTTASPNLNSQVAAQCKTPGCIVCLKGPPPSFSKGTPIWAQILHLVLYALTESAKVSVMGSPKMKVKRYFHLRDDIYEYISIHWDVICRRERIKNWRHTIGMTLSHYQNLFQNGYHIYQNTGYWSMKDNVPSPYVIDTMIGDGSPTKKRKYVQGGNGNAKNTASSDKDKDSNMTAFISDFPVVDGNNSALTNPLNTTSTTSINPGTRGSVGLPSFTPPHSTLSSSSPHPSHSAVKFDAMKSDIERFKREMNSLQSEIDSLQEQLQVKKAEEQLLKFLQEGISNFRDKIKQRIDLLRAEMISQNEHSHPRHHDRQVQIASTELIQLRDMGNDLKNAFQFQFARLSNMNNKLPPSSNLASNLSSSC
jgi:hypothetical protein